jgi:hypothetical protein
LRRRHKLMPVVCRDSSVGIATHYGLDGPEIEFRWGARFSAPVQTGPGTHPASYTMGARSFLGVKQPGRGVDHPPPSSAEVKEGIELYLYSPSGSSWPFLGRTLPLLTASFGILATPQIVSCSHPPLLKIFDVDVSLDFCHGFHRIIITLYLWQWQPGPQALGFTYLSSRFRFYFKREEEDSFIIVRIWPPVGLLRAFGLLVSVWSGYSGRRRAV